jgi:hypothetical protein
VIAVIEGRLRADVEDFFNSIPSRLKRTVKTALLQIGRGSLWDSAENYVKDLRFLHIPSKQSVFKPIIQVKYPINLISKQSKITRPIPDYNYLLWS